MSRSVALIVGFVALLTPPAAAQFVELDPVVEADRLYHAGHLMPSLELMEQRITVDSTDVAALWRAARAAVVMGIAEEGSRNQNEWLDPAIGWADRAVELEPTNLEAIYWRGVATGRRAMNAAPSYAAGLVEVVYDDAHRILAADSLHAGAHNMLGKLNYEIMTVSRIKRLIARTFMGNDALDDMSWENAEYHLARAVEAAPDFVLFSFDLAQLYRRRGRRDEAIEAYRRVLALPAVHPVDAGYQAQARAQLADWGVQVGANGAAPTDR